MTQTTVGFITAVLAAAVQAGTPLLYAALGEILTERVGIINLSVEGIMLVGAVSGFLATVATKNLAVGILGAAIAGGIIAAIHAFLSVSLKVNQVVSGLSLSLFATGVSGYLGKPIIGVPAPVSFKPYPIPGLSKIPVLGQMFFKHNLLVYGSYFLVAFLWYFLYKTRPGLHMRSVGESPRTADSLGINVNAVQYAYTIIGGALSGIAGAYLSLAYAPSWIEQMTAGRGWIAIALVIFAVWNPLRAMVGAYLFGGIEALGFRIQVVGATISPIVLKMMPYIFTIAVLIITTARSATYKTEAPQALGVPYERE
ncbi:MAG TPA: ABC transporter permease [Bacillota bacterium]|nr:ABC transporter permease [Bacillota bacterium]